MLFLALSLSSLPRAAPFVLRRSPFRPFSRPRSLPPCDPPPARPPPTGATTPPAAGTQLVVRRGRRRRRWAGGGKRCGGGGGGRRGSGRATEPSRRKSRPVTGARSPVTTITQHRLIPTPARRSPAPSRPGLPHLHTESPHLGLRPGPVPLSGVLFPYPVPLTLDNQPSGIFQRSPNRPPPHGSEHRNAATSTITSTNLLPLLRQLLLRDGGVQDSRGTAGHVLPGCCCPCD